MLDRITRTLTSWPFILCLVLLLINDWVLKAEYPGFITGKLSDFAGIAVVAFLALAAFPHRRKIIYGILALLFLWWKSPASASFIQFFNDVAPYQIGRVVDYGDLVALVMLPVCAYLVKHEARYSGRWESLRQTVAVPVAIVALLAVMATSAPSTRIGFFIRAPQGTPPIPRAEMTRTIAEFAANYQIPCNECDHPLDSAAFIDFDNYLQYWMIDSANMAVQMAARRGGFACGGDPEDALIEMVNALTDTLRKHHGWLEVSVPLNGVPYQRDAFPFY